MCTSAFAHSDSAHKRHGSALREGASAFAFPSPTLRTAVRNTVAQRRGLFSGAARTFPGSGRRANDILYIRVRRREGEHVLHRAASNDVDNFSVDNPLWITAAAGGRLLRGRRGRLCGGSVNADGGSVNAGAEVQTQTGRVRKAVRAMGTRRRRLSAPWPRFHGADRADVYIIIRVRATCCGECALNPPTSPPISRRRPPLAPAQRHALPSTSARPRSADARPQAARCIPRRPHNPFSAEDLRSPPHSDTPSPSTSAPPRSADARPQAARCTPADLTTHSPPKTSPRPRTATRPSRALPLPHTAPTHARRLRDAFPADLTTHSPQRHAASPFRSASGTKKRHRTVHVRCRMFRSTVVAVGHLGW